MGDGAEYGTEECYDVKDLELYGFEPYDTASIMQDRHKQNKLARIGELIRCPVCNKLIQKKTKDHTFCSNGRRKKGGNCKDRYWNTVDDERRERAKTYKRV